MSAMHAPLPLEHDAQSFTLKSALPPVPTIDILKILGARQEQRLRGFLECFGEASGGQCAESGCAYHVECIRISRIMPSIMGVS